MKLQASRHGFRHISAKNAGADWFAGVENFFGGKQQLYTNLFKDGRNGALQELKMRAANAGANAVSSTHDNIIWRRGLGYFGLWVCRQSAENHSLIVDKFRQFVNVAS